MSPAVPIFYFSPVLVAAHMEVDPFATHRDILKGGRLG